MRPLSEYDVLIFDCDGVILDSNRLKIEAMQIALVSSGYCNERQVIKCTEFFSANFGTSRFQHVRYFVDNILELSADVQTQAYDSILELYSAQCYELYLRAEVTPGFLELIRGLSAPCYVASGSVEAELIKVFEARGLSQYFTGIYGAPTPKVDIVRVIRDKYPDASLLMVGDAVSDHKAALCSNIDFIFYAPFSNVTEKMLARADEYNFSVVNDYATIQ